MEDAKIPELHNTIGGVNLKRLIACMTCALALSVYATPATDASIEQLISVMKMEKLTAEMTANMQEAIQRMGSQAIASNKNFEKLSVKQKQIFEESMGGMFRLMFDEVGWSKSKDRHFKLLQKHLTEEEVNKAISFYSSPEGASFIEKQPRIQKEAMEALGPSMQEIQKKIAAHMAKMVEDMKAADAPRPEPAKPTPSKD